MRLIRNVVILLLRKIFRITLKKRKRKGMINTMLDRVKLYEARREVYIIRF